MNPQTKIVRHVSTVDLCAAEAYLVIETPKTLKKAIVQIVLIA